MNVHHYVDGSRTNFGDDLNRWIWSRLLELSSDEQDETLLLGIGTILSRNFVPPGKRYIVLGSGVGYDLPPDGFGGPAWNILAVRGPLTAAALGLPPEKAVVDAAALLRLLPECEPLPASKRNGIAFMPHYELLPEGNWKQVCHLAGVEFLDPLADSKDTVQRIRNARLVIADAMHAAIVADALRVPWMPVVISPQANTFKWLDWTMSLNLSYKPARLPASTLLEALRNSSFPLWGNKLFFEHRDRASALAAYDSFKRKRSSRCWKWWRRRMFQLTYSLPRRILTSAAFAKFRKWQDQNRTQRAAEQLRKIANLPPYQSDEDIFQTRLKRLAELVASLKVNSGRA